MKKNVILLTLTVLCLVGISITLAVEVKEEQYKCPLCGNNVKTYILVKNEKPKDFDSDFCPHYTGEAPLTYQVTTCPICLYSSYTAANEYKSSLTDEQKSRLNEELEPDRKKTRLRRRKANPSLAQMGIRRTLLQN